MPEKFQSWQFWAAAKKLLGESNLMLILGRRNGRTIRLYSADPRYTQDRCRDPLQHLHIIFQELDTFGRGDVARLAIRYLESALDDEATADQVAALLPTMEEEILADYQAVYHLQSAIRDGLPVDQVADLAAEARAEINRTLARYIKEQQK